MNALVNDQLRKLRSIAYEIEKNVDDLRITFGRYTGDTQEYRRDAYEQFKNLNKNEEPPESELLSREEMRKNPPNILITNYAMLEYLLLRPDDDIFFTGEYGNKWKFIVLDEAHVYNGALGMEIGMLLRRVKQRVNRVSKYPLTCIITSATLISSTLDYEKVIDFAQNLLGEKFEWNTENQDIVIGEREAILEDKRFFLPRSEFEELYEMLVEYKNTLNFSKIRDWLNKKQKDFDFELFDNPFESLYHFLKFEGNIIYIKELLKDSALNFNEMANLFFNKEFNDIDIVKKIIEIGVWLRKSNDQLSLIPSRFHYLLKTPESVFISFIPEIEIYLERHKHIFFNESKIPVFELNVCKRCGQLFLFGNIDENGFYTQLKNQIIFSDEETHFFMLIEEDEMLGYDDTIIEDTQKICVNCGKILRRGNCICDNPVQYNIKIIPNKGRNLTKCHACDYSSQAVNRFLILNRDTPSAVIATNLFQNAPTNEKLLAFTDSRQKAAFFPPFLEFTYNLLLYRHLILKTIQEANVQDFRLEGLAINLMKKCEQYEIFHSSWDDIQKKLIVWRHIINEFYTISSRNSLETLGLIKFTIIFPENWEIPYFLMSSPWNLSKQEVKNLYQIFMNTLRRKKAFSMPADGPNYDDEIFERVGNKKQWFFKGKLRKGEKGKASKGLISFLPRGKINSRINVLKKILKGKNPLMNKDEIQRISEACLSDIWEDILNNWIASCKKDIFYRHDSVYQLNHQFWNISVQNIENLGICNKCGHITHLNVGNVCPTYRCTGTLTYEKKKIKDFQEINHFCYLYQFFKPKKLRAKEHTAQLTTEKATKTQIDFIKGEVDLLSCSTTFELGVDLGDLQIIFLTNIPPHPSNYVQRAGRAGRRKDSAGFTVSLALLRSHDLTYFNDPIKMINGYIKPPIINIKNEKIILRHINSLVLSQFFKENPLYFYGVGKSGKVKWLLFNEKLKTKSAYEMIYQYIDSHFNDLKYEIEHILPTEINKNKFMNKEFILNNLFSDASKETRDYGKLYLANVSTVKEVEKLEELKRENKEKYSSADDREQNRIHYFNKWIGKRINTIKNEPLINFLSRNSVIPKYGFPIDVVSLDILNKNQNANEVALERDLRMAISEYAPGSSVVANAKIWKSAGLKSLKDQTWPIYEYLFCPKCGQFNINRYIVQSDDSQSEFLCINCKLDLKNERREKFIDPIFGFLTDRNEKPIDPGRESPERQYFSRPFFHSLTPMKTGRFTKIEKDRQIQIDWEYAPNGELSVLCRGKKEQGFIICYECGRSWNKAPKLKGSHISPYGYNCNGLLHYRIHLGHRFQTDILKLTIQKSPEINLKVGYSLLFSLLEGICEELQIVRKDLDGCLFNRNEDINNAIIIYDNVPGGAGHVKRIIESEEIFIKIIKSAINRLETCTCGEETSCYGCLRNYTNQYCHDLLSRGEALGILNQIYPKNLIDVIIQTERQEAKIDILIDISEERKEISGIILNYEIKIRVFIKTKLEDEYGEDWWDRGIPNSIKEAVSRKLSKEIETEKEKYENIDFLNVYDYHLIIFYRDNREIFSKYFPEPQIQYIFKRISVLRNRVYHSRSLLQDHEKLRVHIEDILKRIP